MKRRCATRVVGLSAGTIRPASVVCQVAFEKSSTSEAARRCKIRVAGVADKTEANTVALTGADVSDAVASGVGGWESLEMVQWCTGSVTLHDGLGFYKGPLSRRSVERHDFMSNPTGGSCSPWFGRRAHIAPRRRVKPCSSRPSPLTLPPRRTRYVWRQNGRSRRSTHA